MTDHETYFAEFAYNHAAGVIFKKRFIESVIFTKFLSATIPAGFLWLYFDEI
jgi:hypothetical protein